MGYMSKIKSYYEANNIKDFPDYYIQGWENETAQKLRFKELIGPRNLDGKKILDVGCGTGNLLEYIRTLYKNFDYTGVDILEHMIDRARKKKLEGRFLCIDLFKNNPFPKQSFDVIFSSGIFNLNLGNNKKFLLDAVKVFEQLSRNTISFNLLWDRSPDPEDTYYYFSPEEVRQWLTDIYGQSCDISIMKGYLSNDFTVSLIKKA